MRVTLTLLLWISAATPGFANVYDDCQAAIDAGDTARAKEITKVIQRFTTVPSPDNLLVGANCFTFATGQQHVYSLSAGAFILSTEEEYAIMEAQRQNAENRKEQERLAAERLAAQQIMEELAAAVELARIERVQAVWLAVEQACHDLYEDDPVLTLTNETCIKVFLEAGLPE